MSILGLSSQDIDDRYDDVVAFAEIGDAIDSPIQSYSSGMAARLGFACAIYTEPDILLIDEVLAVGDVKFRAKCYRRLAKLRDQGTAFVLVSHNPNSMLSLCETSVYLYKGEVIQAGDTSAVMQKYESDLFGEGNTKAVGRMALPQKSQHESLGLDITSLAFRDTQGQLINTPVSGQPAYFCLTCRVQSDLSEVNVNIAIREKLGEGEHVLALSTRHDDETLTIDAGKNEIQLYFPYVGLRPGFYRMNVHVRRGPFYIMDSVEGFEFQVESSGAMSQCQFYQPREWRSVSLEEPQ
jgi:lipopolysaccharide transport system ATP-binding protein